MCDRLDSNRRRTLPAFAGAVAVLAALSGCGGAGAGAGGDAAGNAAAQAGAAPAPKVQVVRIGTGNEIEKVDSTKNAVPYTAAVADADGNPAVGVQVGATLASLQYMKGQYVWTGEAWAPMIAAICPNEDANGNLTLDAGEDINGDGKLTPANPAVATPVSATSNGSGFVDMKIVYPRDQSTWLQVRLTVTAAIGLGTEAVATRDLWLPGLAADYTNKDLSPPGRISPYGTSTNCADPN